VNLLDRFVGLEALSRYLEAHGWKNRIENGAIAVRGRQVVRISMRVGGAMWFTGPGPTLRLGPVPLFASHLLPVQVRYAMDVDPAKDPRAYRGELAWEREGLFALGEVTEAWFEGGSICERLNQYPARLLALARCIRRFEKFKLEPDVAEASVRAVHQQKMQLRFSLIGDEMFDVERNFPRFEFFAALEWLAAKLGEGSTRSTKRKRGRKTH